ncbi:MAG: hypothetical protein Q8P40_14075, partial [Nitrospirota bacterium]|nr:hypothetical protein [Nitrospirota bacterium]
SSGSGMMCKHEWRWNYDCFEDARELDGELLGIPVKCKLCGAEGVEWYKHSHVEIRQQERTWDCYTLSEDDIKEVAERKGMNLEGIDLEDVISSIKKGIEWALDNRDEIIEEGIRQAGKVKHEKAG